MLQIPGLDRDSIAKAIRRGGQTCGATLSSFICFDLQSLQERRFDDIWAVYHLLNDQSAAASNSSCSISNDLASTSSPAWPSLSDDQHLEKVVFHLFQSFLFVLWRQFRVIFFALLA